jgi:phage-related protein
MKEIRFYRPAEKAIQKWPQPVKVELGAVLTRLAEGQIIGMPDVRSMSVVADGVSEIRIRAATGAYRAFYVNHQNAIVVVFHAFVKKSQKTPLLEIKTGTTRLRQALKDIGGKINGQ